MANPKSTKFNSYIGRNGLIMALLLKIRKVRLNT